MRFEERLVEVALHDYERIRVVRIGGSRGRSKESKDSDWDVFLVIEPDIGDGVGFLDIATSFITSLGVPTVFRRPYWVPYYGFSASAFYDSVGAVDFNVRSSMDNLANYMLSQGTRVLFDRDGVMPSVLRDSSLLELPSKELADRFATRVWFTSLRAAKELRRGRFEQYKKLCREVVEYLAGLSRLVSGITPPGLDFTQPLRGIEDLPRSSGSGILIEMLNEIDSLQGAPALDLVSHLDRLIEAASDFIESARSAGLLAETTLDDVALRRLSTEVASILDTGARPREVTQPGSAVDESY
jgi:hypothetical protein